MFKKTIHILTNLHKVPIKIFNKLKFFYYKSFGNKEFFVNKQIECFSYADLDWTNGKKKLNEIKKNLIFLRGRCHRNMRSFFRLYLLTEVIKLKKY